MATIDEDEPLGPPPAWLDDWERELGAALDACDPKSPTSAVPPGTSLADLAPGSTVAVFIKEPETSRDGHERCRRAHRGRGRM